MAERIFSTPIHTINQAINPAITPKTILNIDISYFSSLKGTHSIASGETRRSNYDDGPSLKGTNVALVNPSPSGTETYSHSNVGFHPTLFYLSPAGILKTQPRSSNKRLSNPNPF